MRPDGTVVQVTAVGAVPACVEGVLEECGMAFQVSLEDAGPVVEVIGRTRAGGEMVHVFDFRFGRDIASVQDWDAEARDVVGAFDAFETALVHRGVRGAPEGEDLYEDIKGYKDEVLEPMAEALRKL